MFKGFNVIRDGRVRLFPSSAISPHSHFNTNFSPTHDLPALYKNRTYASASHFPHQDYSWPSTRSFTPYDVLNLPRDGLYSKRHYYDLVKIYHPDRPLKDHPLFHQLTPETRLHRYRIVVEAHEILSDPIKRAAYDRNGTGWNHSLPETKIEWNTRGPNIYANATWEDWEQWHNRHQGPQQHVVDQRTFTRLVILLVLFGGALQASWIGQMNTSVQDRLQDVNDKSTRFLHGRQENTIKQMNSNDARVQGFLIRRDPTGAGLKGHEHPIYQKELNHRRSLDESCQAEDKSYPESSLGLETDAESPELSASPA